MRDIGLILISTAALLAPATVLAGESDESSPGSAISAAEEGVYVPTLLPAATMRQAAVVRGFGGYDSAAKAGIFDSEARVRLWGPISVRGGVSYSKAKDTVRPRVGAAVQILQQERAGVDSSLSLSYKAEGFTEPEGELELEAALGRRFGSVMAILNLVYGQDPEGNERDGEARLAAVASVAHGLTVGGAANVRIDLSPEKDAGSTVDPGEDGGALDFTAGPVVGYAWNRFALTAQAGLSVLKLRDDGGTRSGLIVVGGVGTAF